MEVLLKINDEAKDFIESSLNIESIITNRIDTASFVLEGTHDIEEGATEVIISDPTETVRYFAGIIATAGLGLSGITPRYSVDAQDFTVLTDGVIINEVYENMTDAEILDAAFTKYLPEIDASTFVTTGLLHDRLVCNRIYLRDLIDILAQNSGYDWYIDYWKYLHYFGAGENPAPWAVSDTPDDVTSFAVEDMVFNRDATGLINRVIVQGGKYLSDDSEFLLAGNGVAVEILLPYALHAPEGETGILVYKNTGTDVSPTWTAQTVGIDNIGDLADFDCLYNYAEKILRFATAPADLKLSVKVEGRYQVPIIVRATSSASFERYGRYFDGKVVDTDIDSRAQAALVAKGVLAEHAFVKERGRFITSRDGLASGQTITITDTLRGISGEYIINTVVTRILGGETCQYEVSFGEYNPDLIDLIIKAKAGAQQKISADIDEKLAEIITQAETLEMSEAMDIHTDDFTTTGIVSRVLASPPLGMHHVQHERLDMTEDTALTTHETENYLWDDPDSRWGFATWG